MDLTLLACATGKASGFIIIPYVIVGAMLIGLVVAAITAIALFSMTVVGTFGLYRGVRSWRRSRRAQLDIPPRPSLRPSR